MMVPVVGPCCEGCKKCQGDACSYERQLVVVSIWTKLRWLLGHIPPGLGQNDGIQDYSGIWEAAP